MKKILLFLFASCFMNISAQNVVISRDNTEATSINSNSEAEQKQTQKEKDGRKQLVCEELNSPVIGTSTYIPVVQTFKVKNVSFQMVEVKGGTFNMGATSEQGSGARSDEKPVHKVTLSNYYIGKTEVTQALWKAVMGNNPSRSKGNNRPVEHVSWDDCQVFISKLNSMTGKNFRLPTEAEWEFAARGGIKSKGYRYSGSDSVDDVAWSLENSIKKVFNRIDKDFDEMLYENRNHLKTPNIAEKQPNELGIYDMSGNVWEWCQDWYGDYSSNAQSNPTGPDSGEDRVYRGGSWDLDAWFSRVSSRYNFNSDFSNYNLGFRLCLSE